MEQKISDDLYERDQLWNEIYRCGLIFFLTVTNVVTMSFLLDKYNEVSNAMLLAFEVLLSISSFHRTSKSYYYVYHSINSFITFAYM